MLRVEGDSVVLKGINGARIFRRGQSPIETEPGTEPSQLVEPVSEE